MTKAIPLNKLHTLGKSWRLTHFYRTNPDTHNSERFYRVSHYNKDNNTYTVDSLCSYGYTEDREIYLKANTIVYI